MTDVKEAASHLRTLGAYVQKPTPAIVGLDDYSIVGSQDAKSLYPTIVVLLNIGYDTFRGRIYEDKIIGRFFNYLARMKKAYKSEPDLLEEAIVNIKTMFFRLAQDYLDRGETVKISGKKFKEFTRDYYTNLFAQLAKSKYSLSEISKPINDETYYLLKSVLYPLLEAINWLSELNKGYSEVSVDYVFHNEKFDDKYENNHFYVIHNINSTKSQLMKLSKDELKNSVMKNFLITPYGTYFEKHDRLTSFECPLILSGMDDRSYVKNQMLIEAAIVENWNKLSQRQQAAFMIRDKTINKEIAKEVIEIVGDSDPKMKEKQLKVLSEIVFDNIVEYDELHNKLSISVQQKNSKSNSIKVTLNSGYGLNGLLTWSYGNNLIANSITTGGKIYGIKLFQQIASNTLARKRKEIGK